MDVLVKFHIALTSVPERQFEGRRIHFLLSGSEGLSVVSGLHCWGPDQVGHQGGESEAVSLGTKVAEIERATGMHHGQGLAFKVTQSQQPSNEVPAFTVHHPSRVF